MSNAGIPLRIIQEISGHSNLEQLQHYLEVKPDQVKGAIASLSMLSYTGKVVIDGKTVIVTSANFTTSDIHGDFKNTASRGNPNNLLRLSSPELAKLFTQEKSRIVLGRNL